VGRVVQDDLPVISISRLRALGLVTPEMTEFLVRIGEVEQTVGVTLRRFPNGGSWSRFVCPCCGWSVRMLRLLDGAVLCTRCCIRRGVSPRAWSMSVKQRAERRIPRLRAMLESETSLRLKPVLWGKMERRSRLEAALRGAELRVAQYRVPRKAMVVDNPCDEPDYSPPKPRPRTISKSKLSP
jgi:hypothetical protein